MSRRYHILDVFTDRAGAGNPLAIVLDADGLETPAMQAIAAEFGLSETVFVLPPEQERHRARLRIFTTQQELPFAGHPTVGSAVLLGTLDHPATIGDVLFGLEETIGVVTCAVSLKTDGGFARFQIPKLPEEAGAAADITLIAQALGLDKRDIGFENHHPCRFGAGVPFTFVPLRSLEAAGRAKPDLATWTQAFGSEGLGSAYLYTRDTVDPDASFHARMFAPGAGMPEDPATGGAAAALAGVVQHFDDLSAGDHLLRIEQGLEMGRPSVIELTLTIEGLRLVAASIGGSAVLVRNGILETG